MEAAAVLDTAAEVLDFARARRAAADRAEAEVLRAAVAWAAMHSVDSIEDAAMVWDGHFGESELAIAGLGAPLVAEFCIAEFAAAIGLPTDAGRDYLGEALELRHRLPRLWAKTLGGDLAAWRARRIARSTLALSPEAAAYVDRHVAHVAHQIGPAAVDRLVEEAIARHMPETAERACRDAADARGFTIDHRQVSFAGTSAVYGELDLADALDLDAAIRGIVGQLGDLGCAESMDVRRSMAAGELARRQLALDLTTQTDHRDDPDEAVLQGRAERVPQPRKPVRQVLLYVHLSEAALTSPGVECGAGLQVGRVENTRSPVTADTIRTWCGRNPDTQVTVRPVIDLNQQIRVDQYEIPDRLTEQTQLRDGTCVFPWCSRPARSCDTDHVIPHTRGGPTCTENLAPLCRRHHRLKTHSSWTYTALEPGTYLWSSPHRYQFLRDHTGTLDVTRDKRRPSVDPPET